jgi:hypothetical protein
MRVVTLTRKGSGTTDGSAVSPDFSANESVADQEAESSTANSEYLLRPKLNAHLFLNFIKRL